MDYKWDFEINRKKNEKFKRKALAYHMLDGVPGKVVLYQQNLV